jgi:hypothetical protein
VTAVKALYGHRLELIGVANVGGAPGWVHGVIRKSFTKKYSYPILLDWSGRLPALLHCERDVANVFLLDTLGRVLATERGEYKKDSLEKLAHAADLAINIK